MRAVKFITAWKRSKKKGRESQRRRRKEPRARLEAIGCPSRAQKEQKKEGRGLREKMGSHFEAGPGALKARMKAVRRFDQGLIGARAKRLEPKRGKTKRTPNERKKKEKKCTVVCQGFLHQTKVGRVKDAVLHPGRGITPA